MMGDMPEGTLTSKRTTKWLKSYRRLLLDAQSLPIHPWIVEMAERNPWGYDEGGEG